MVKVVDYIIHQGDVEILFYLFLCLFVVCIYCIYENIVNMKFTRIELETEFESAKKDGYDTNMIVTHL